MSKYDVNRLKKVTVALNTPFDRDGNVDLEAVKCLVEYFCKKGVKQMYVCGSTGEGFLLDSGERMKVVETVTAQAAGRMNIIVHVGCADTRHSAELAKHAKAAGADGISAVPCVYYRMGEESVYEHWMKITEAADIPFFIYNIPQLTGFHLSMKLFERMLENERVAGLKCSSDPVKDIMRFKTVGGKDFLVFNGSDSQFIAGRLMGADGGIGGTYGAMPELYLKMQELCDRGEWKEAQKVQEMVNSFVSRLSSFPSMYGAVKSIISLDGCPIGNPRLPFLPVSTEDPDLISLYRDIRQAVEETAGM
ncbi:MAG: dihydrodipicolinate synthase family protein [Hungatella hathewayi]|nr:dihydrodipicolinate synthase family protein [Hungatella hathewayi]